MIDLSIIIPVFNNANLTKACLQDLSRLPSNHEVIVVDNNSSDHTAQVLTEMKEVFGKDNPKFLTFPQSENLGFGKANNVGYAASIGRNILFLNNDIRIKTNHSTWTKSIIESCDSGDISAAQGGLLNQELDFICEKNGEQIEAIVKKHNLLKDDRSSFEDMHRGPGHMYLSGWCLGSSRENFDKLKQHYQGPWDEEFFAYFEDGDITWRAEEAGIPLGVYREITKYIHHFGRMTGKKLGLNNLYTESQKIIRRKWQEKFNHLRTK